MSDFEFKATVRTEIGTGASRRLRNAGKLPAVLYGANEEAIAITLEHSKVNQAQENEAFYSHILVLDIDGKKVEAIVKAMQRHPFKPKLLHADFMRITRGVALSTTVPLHCINEETSVGLKAGGNLVHQLTEVSIKCLPKDLPEFIEVDIQDLDVGGALHLSDLTLPAGVEIPDLALGPDHDLSVVSIQPPKGGSEDEEATDEDSEETTDSGE